jgi:hypothetical protein
MDLDRFIRRCASRTTISQMQDMWSDKFGVGQFQLHKLGALRCCLIALFLVLHCDICAALLDRFENKRLSDDSTFFVALKSGIPVLPPPFVTAISTHCGDCSGGTIVTVTGLHFGFDSSELLSVSFGQHPCEDFEWTSRTELRCVTPAVEIKGEGAIGSVFALASTHARTAGFFACDVVVETSGGGPGHSKPKFCFLNGNGSVLSTLLVELTFALNRFERLQGPVQ